MTSGPRSVDSSRCPWNAFLARAVGWIVVLAWVAIVAAIGFPLARPFRRHALMVHSSIVGSSALSQTSANRSATSGQTS